MGIVQSSTTISLPITNVAYSATIGGMYVRNPENETKLASVKADVGDAEWKKGFQGSTSKAVQLSRKAGLGNIKLSGILTSVRVRDAESDGRKTSYLNVGLRDADGRYYLSLDCGTESAQRLIRKLANCQPATETEISLWASMEDIKEGQSRAYASHGASVKQVGAEVAGVSPSLELKGLVETSLKAIRDAGIEDKEILGRHRQKVTAEYHIGLANKKSEAFAKFYESRDLPADDHVSDSEMPAGMPTDDIPVEAYGDDPFKF